MYKKEFKVGDFEFDVDKILKIAILAGEEILKIYQKDFEVEYKDDKSPLTEADKKSHNVIVEGLKRYNLPILSEEGKDVRYEERKKWRLFWMIDPLDGTKEFIKKNGEFTINIALIKENEPIFGVVYAPAINEIYFTDLDSAFLGEVKNSEVVNVKKLPIEVKKDKIVVVASKSHLNEETKIFIESIKGEKVFISKGSSLKICMVASGVADIYPRLAPTMEWDTAAADAVARKANRGCYKYDDKRLLEYNKKNLKNPYFIVK